jgi:hypothetical protein
VVWIEDILSGHFSGYKRFINFLQVTIDKILRKSHKTIIILRGIVAGHCPAALIVSAPGKHLLAEYVADEYVGYQPRVSSIAIRKTMDVDDLVFESHGDFVAVVCFIFYPVLCIVGQLF